MSEFYYYYIVHFPNGRKAINSTTDEELFKQCSNITFDTYNVESIKLTTVRNVSRYVYFNKEVIRHHKNYEVFLSKK